MLWENTINKAADSGTFYENMGVMGKRGSPLYQAGLVYNIDWSTEFCKKPKADNLW